MSIAEFSETMQSKIFTDWLQLDKPENSLVNTDIVSNITKTLQGSSLNLSLQYEISNPDPQLQNVVDTDINKATDRLRIISASNEFIDNLLNLKSSPSFVEILRDGLAAALKGTLKDVQYKASKAIINVSTSSKKSTGPQLRDLQGKFYSATLLKELINSQLQHVVSANMGNEPYPGGQRKILNYRTGRFAASVEAVKLTTSKEGMITAFYDYMKYPYATFSKGGAQEHPASRDPKLLIAKSIREIAATKVKNRMRSVLV